MFEFAWSQLRDLGSGNEGENDVGGEPLLKMALNAQGMCGVDEDAGMLGRDDRLNDGGKIIYIGESLYTKEDVVEATGLSGSVFGCSND